MAEAAKRASSLTTLSIGAVEIPVGLYTVKADPSKVSKFDTAGPGGGKLVQEIRGRAAEDEAPVDEPVRSDPIAGDPVEAPPLNGEQATVSGAVVPGEYTTVLVEDGTGEVVLPEKVRRGVRLDDGRFIDCTDQLAEIEAQTKLDEMRIVSFIDVGQVPRFRVLAAYYVGTNEPGAPRALRLLYEAMRARRRAAVVKWTKTSRQALGVLVPDARRQVLVALQIVWAEDVRDVPAPADTLRSAVVTEQEVAAACELVDAMHDTIESLDELRDDAIALREELKAKALAGEVVRVIEPRAPAEESMDLMGALEASLAATRA